ncbi:MAG: PLP-dependent aminotransferase family protein [Pseudomonadota bacterium]
MPESKTPFELDSEQWAPQIAERSGSRYRAIADALQADIAAGRLQPGEKLPTHRDLAWRLGCTVGTVTRAYVEAERRGLVVGEVGRGTFVRPLQAGYVTMFPTESQLPTVDGGKQKRPIDLSANAPPNPPLAGRIAKTMAEVAQDIDFVEYLRYRPTDGLESHSAAGAAWMANFGVDVDPAQVIPTNGAQHGMLAAVSAAVRPGETLLTENLVFFGVKSIAHMLGLRLQGVEMDEQGIMPEALEAAIRSSGARALYCCSTIQNPTCAMLSHERWQAIANVCERHGVIIIEDDIYHFLLDKPVPTFAGYLPEQTIYVASLSKVLAPALRTGYIAAPKRCMGGVLTAIRASGLMASPLTHEVAARLIRNGTAMENGRQIRERARERQVVARRYLADWHYRSQPTSLHLWLSLPENWRRESFTKAALQRGVSVSSSDLFAIGRQSVPHAVRLAIGAPRDTEELERALSIIRDLLRSDEVSPHCDLPPV